MTERIESILESMLGADLLLDEHVVESLEHYCSQLTNQILCVAKDAANHRGDSDIQEGDIFNLVESDSILNTDQYQMEKINSEPISHMAHSVSATNRYINDLALLRKEKFDESMKDLSVLTRERYGHMSSLSADQKPQVGVNDNEKLDVLDGLLQTRYSLIAESDKRKKKKTTTT